jgi:hypothetical protein
MNIYHLTGTKLKVDQTTVFNCLIGWLPVSVWQWSRGREHLRIPTSSSSYIDGRSPGTVQIKRHRFRLNPIQCSTASHDRPLPCNNIWPRSTHQLRTMCLSVTQHALLPTLWRRSWPAGALGGNHSWIDTCWEAGICIVHRTWRTALLDDLCMRTLVPYLELFAFREKVALINHDRHMVLTMAVLLPCLLQSAIFLIPPNPR